MQTSSIENVPVDVCTTQRSNNVINAASKKDGAKVLFATDEWFATAVHLLYDHEAIFDPNLYCTQGKVMDGWETRRKRSLGHDFSIIQLSCRIRITSIVIDTAYFTGNQTPYIGLLCTDINDIDQETEIISSLPNAMKRVLLQMKSTDDVDWYDITYQGTCSSIQEIQHAETSCEKFVWHDILPSNMIQLLPGYEATRYHHFDLTNSTDNIAQRTATHLRLNYYPDGGVARIRVYGIPITNEVHQVLPKQQPLYMPITTGSTCTVTSWDDPQALSMCNKSNEFQLPETDSYDEVSSSLLGGTGIYCTNQHYGTPSQLLAPTTGLDMGDGWETARQKLRPKILQPLVYKSNDINNDGMTESLVDYGNLMEYCIIQLGRSIPLAQCIVVDTKHFKGNYPESIDIYGCYVTADISNTDAKSFESGSNNVINWENDDIMWFPLVRRCRLSPHAVHIFDSDQVLQHSNGTISHVRIRIFPDGGLSRVRIYGSKRDL